MVSFLRKMFGGGTSVDFNTLLKQGAIIVDVRTPAEFRSGHIKGAVNIPLDQLRNKTAELKQKNKPVITCCRSGARSAMAKSALKAAGVECWNGGAWEGLDRIIN